MYPYYIDTLIKDSHQCVKNVFDYYCNNHNVFVIVGGALRVLALKNLQAWKRF